ncbi:hypothetical protein [Jannaschia sp. LMIT008]|uniref:hypothetical protein n=1 Tax=Jannaschia maritima TaxID=3032585 RepID=UPI00281127AD|nr:hypothetical protein [Jannaschia sp. LMIT008]
MTDRTSGGRGTDWTALAVLVGGLAWATWYVLSTRANPIDEPEAAWLITPLLLAAWASAPFVAWSALGPLRKRLAVEPDSAIGAHRNRTAFVLGLPLLAGSIWLLGFVATVALWVPALLLAMRERRVAVHVGIVGGLLAAVGLGFSWALGVDLPLWPRGLG